MSVDVPVGSHVAVRANRLARLSSVHVVEPESTFAWDLLGGGQVLPDSLLSVADLGLRLSEKQRARLSREELAALLASSIRFEAMVNVVFSREIGEASNVADPRYTYMLHEIGEETRHQRAFIRLIEQLRPRATNPFDAKCARLVQRRIMALCARQPALFCVLLLAGEEIPDLFQKLASKHPDTDPLVRDVSRYHRTEEARHLSFARAVLPERWARASWLERMRVRRLAPRLIGLLYATMLHPGVYETVGLPGWKTWRAVNRSRSRRAIRYHATRPILDALCRLGVVERGRIPRGWRRLCGVDRHGRPLADDPALPSTQIRTLQLV